VPDVSGEVIDVPVTGNTPLKAGDVLFKIDPVLFKTKVDSLQAQLDLAQLRLAETTRLSKTGAGRAFDVEQSQAEVEQLSAELVGAKWDLDKPRPMAMSLISRCEKALALQASHCLPSWRLSTRPTRSSALRFRKSTPDMSSLANPSRSRSSLLRRRVYTGKVESILQAVATGQTKTSGAAVMPEAIQSVPFVARINLDDAEFAASLPAGSAGTAAIFTIMSKRRMSYEKCSYGRWP